VPTRTDQPLHDPAATPTKIEAIALLAPAKRHVGRRSAARGTEDARTEGMMRGAGFPSVTWFQGLADAMAPERDARETLDPLELTLVVRVLYPEGHDRLIAVEFRDGRCASVTAPADLADVAGPHAVVLEGGYEAWKEMIEAIHAHGAADPEHTLDRLTRATGPLCLRALDDADGRLDLERFHHFRDHLQAFFDEAAAIGTGFVA
jgi:hypothetical protein